jgi:hypothetical protein
MYSPEICKAVCRPGPSRSLWCSTLEAKYEFKRDSRYGISDLIFFGKVAPLGALNLLKFYLFLQIIEEVSASAVSETAPMHFNCCYFQSAGTVQVIVVHVFNDLNL